MRHWLGASRQAVPAEEIQAAFGIRIEEPAPPPKFEVWPEVWEALDIFFCLSTQWEIGPSGHVIGLRYSALEAVLKMRQVPRSRRSQVFEDVITFERIALEAWR